MTLVPTIDNYLWKTATGRRHKALRGSCWKEGLCLHLGGHGCIPRCKGIRSVSSVTVCVKSSSSL